MAIKEFDCLIIGGGPAGLNSALYATRAGLTCGIIDLYSMGGTPVNYCEIENYLGFNKINGFLLSQKFEEHIDCFNIEKFPFQEIHELDLISEIKKIKTLDNEFLAKTVIIAAGASPKKLGILGEEENIGKGVSYCAVCDGIFYKEKVVAVIGGGASALEEAEYLTKFANKVYLIHRRDEFRADKLIQNRAKSNNKIEFILNSIPVEILANDKVNALKIKNIKTNEEKIINVDGVFPYIGLSANSKDFAKYLNLDENGFIKTDIYMRTHIQGVYAVGDIRNTPLRPVITAVADGAIAGVEASKYIANLEETRKNESISL